MEDEFEYAAEINEATPEKLRTVLSAIARARTEWWNAGHTPESDQDYIYAVGVALRSFEE